MTLLEAHKLTLRVLKQVMEEKLDQHNVQLAQVCPAAAAVRIVVTLLFPGDAEWRVRDPERDEAAGGHRRHVMSLHRSRTIQRGINRAWGV